MSAKDIGIKSLIILGMALGLYLFITMQEFTVAERLILRDEAVARTIAEGGGEQEVVGPFLRIPLEGPPDSPAWYAFLLPGDFAAAVELRGEPRKRGIHEVPLYASSTVAQGRFAVDAARIRTPDGYAPRFDRAELWFFVADARGFADAPSLAVGGRPLEVSPMGPQRDARSLQGFSAALPLAGDGKAFEFRLSLNLRGGGSFGLFPAGDESRIRLAMDRWAPEFKGAYLPAEHEIHDEGFSATWSIPSTARALPGSSTEEDWTAVLRSCEPASFAIVQGLDSYQLVNRAIKYALLFIIIPFLGLFAYELLARRLLHPLQYLLVGCAVALFFFLLLSISERVDFGLAFAAAALGTSTLIGVYCAAILKGGFKGVLAGLGLGLLYALLYLIVSAEDNALLVGSLFLFALLAAFMLATRKIDWYDFIQQLGYSPRPAPIAGPAPPPGDRATPDGGEPHPGADR